MTPHILLSGSDTNRINYENAITAAGCTFESYYMPKLDTTIDANFLARFDGLILGGGGDVNPKLYGQENTASEGIDDIRDQIELDLIRHFMDAGKPILGICRGFQLMNVALGGTLHQDIGPDSHPIHTPDWDVDKEPGTVPPDCAHLTRAAEFSFLGQLYGSVFTTNSLHHQAVDKLADPLLAVQWAMEDGCVEGTMHTSYPYIGVQWHPERMCLARAREDTVDGFEIFRYFMTMFKK